MPFPLLRVNHCYQFYMSPARLFLSIYIIYRTSCIIHICIIIFTCNYFSFSQLPVVIKICRYEINLTDTWAWETGMTSERSNIWKNIVCVQLTKFHSISVLRIVPRYHWTGHGSTVPMTKAQETPLISGSHGCDPTHSCDSCASDPLKTWP